MFMRVNLVVQNNVSESTTLMALQAARILVQLLCKHEYDARYQSLEDKLYIAQRYFSLVDLVSSVCYFGKAMRTGMEW